MNGLPEVKKFLKEAGGADLYEPALEIVWKRGHHPEMEIRRCTRKASEKGKKSGGLEFGDVVETVQLASFNRITLHNLLQCKGIAPTRVAADTPVAVSQAAACGALPEPTGWGVWLLGGLASLAGIGLVVRWLRANPADQPWRPDHSRRSARVKKEEAVPAPMANGANGARPPVPEIDDDAI